jgi:hypothetical protein
MPARASRRENEFCPEQEPESTTFLCQAPMRKQKMVGWCDPLDAHERGVIAGMLSPPPVMKKIWGIGSYSRYTGLSPPARAQNSEKRGVINAAERNKETASNEANDNDGNGQRLCHCVARGLVRPGGRSLEPPCTSNTHVSCKCSRYPSRPDSQHLLIIFRPRRRWTNHNSKKRNNAS